MRGGRVSRLLKGGHHFLGIMGTLLYMTTIITSSSLLESTFFGGKVRKALIIEHITNIMQDPNLMTER